jgi:hypothetical protein
MEGLVAMWEKQAATAEKVILMPGWIYFLDVWWIFLLDVLQIYWLVVLWIYSITRSEKGPIKARY